MEINKDKDKSIAALERKHDEQVVTNTFTHGNALAKSAITRDEHSYKHELERRYELEERPLDPRIKDETVRLMGELYKKDPVTFGHSARVGDYVGEFWLRRGVDAHTADEYRTGALLHDIGKLGIPDNVLKKEDILTNEEFNLIQTHAENGLNFISDEMKKSDIIVNSIIHHHEAYEGDRGYPVQSMHGEQIPEEARIVAVFDVWDALSSERQYKEPLPQEKVFSMMKTDQKLDQGIVKEAIGMIQEKEQGLETISYDIAPPEELTLLERAMSGDALAEDILEDHFGMDVGGSGFADHQEKAEMGIAESSTKPLDEVFKNAQDRAHEKNESMPYEEKSRNTRDDRDEPEIGERSLI